MVSVTRAKAASLMGPAREAQAARHRVMAKNVVVTAAVALVAPALRAGAVTSVASALTPGPARLPVARRSAEMTAAVASAVSAPLVRVASSMGRAPGAARVREIAPARCVAMMGVVTAVVSALRVQVAAGMAPALETTSACLIVRVKGAGAMAAGASAAFARLDRVASMTGPVFCQSPVPRIASTKPVVVMVAAVRAVNVRRG